MNALPVQLDELKPARVSARASQLASAVCGQSPGNEHGTVDRADAVGTMRQTVASMTATKSFMLGSTVQSAKKVQLPETMTVRCASARE